MSNTVTNDTVIGIDFETWSNIDIKSRGLDNYFNRGKFQPLACAMVGESYYGDEDVKIFDFVVDPKARAEFNEDLKYLRYTSTFSAHNASFERNVFEKMGTSPGLVHLYDSAVISRCLGAGSHLESAAPQLLDIDKLEVGERLIKKFCVPNEAYDFLPPTAAHVENDPDWPLFLEYMVQDARASGQITRRNTHLARLEYPNELLTNTMNTVGWRVDLDLVTEMQLQYLTNLEELLIQFKDRFGGELNFNSTPQLQRWCRERGMVTTSFDEQHVATYIEKVEKKMVTEQDVVKLQNLSQILEMLLTKRELGGSSLKKLQTILDLTGPDGRLRNQYMHCGAGQSYRTSGRGAQMQNLHRLKKGEQDDVTEILNRGGRWDNEKLARNIRQCFTATTSDGSLIVGDFSSVESRGLAYLAGEQDKLDAYFSGKDLYKVLAAKIYGISYDEVSDTERANGKVGELSCGYGAGGEAVQSFAKKMNINLSLDECTTLVSDWRAANPKIVELWSLLENGLRSAITLTAGEYMEVPIANGLVVLFMQDKTPASLARQHPGARTIRMVLMDGSSQVLERVFQGCYFRGNAICYYKPSETKGGQRWSAAFRDPKTKQMKFYSLYGGKLAGILTQSFCRELFFIALEGVHQRVECEGLSIVGQFHDEIVLDYAPGICVFSLNEAMRRFELEMTRTSLKGFPLAAEIHADYRYIK